MSQGRDAAHRELEKAAAREMRRRIHNEEMTARRAYFKTAPEHRHRLTWIVTEPMRPLSRPCRIEDLL
jgi:hypothetical protein